MIQCKKCGASLQDGTKFCENCGTPTANGKKKKPIYKKWWFWVIVVILIIAIIPSGDDGEVQADETSGEVIQTEPSVEYAVVSISDLLNELEANALNAKDNYEGKLVEITGRVDVIDASGKYISLCPEDSEWSLSSIQCYIDGEDQKEFVKTITRGESVVTLRGKIKSVGEVLGYSLDIHEFVK